HFAVGANGSAQADGVRVDLQAVDNVEAAQGIQTAGVTTQSRNGLEPAVTRLTETGINLDSFEVVAGSQVPGANIHAFAVNFGRTELVIRQSSSQRTVGVAQTGGQSASVALVAVLLFELLRTFSIEGVANTKLEAREV